MPRINARFRGTCRKCSGAIHVGDPIWFAGKKTAYHIACWADSPGDEKTPPPRPSGRRKRGNSTQGKENVFSVEWGRLKEAMLAAFNGNFTAFPNHESHVNSHLVTPNVGWQGYTADDCKRWLTSGYQTTALQNLGQFNPPLRKKRRILFGEDGEEFHYDIAASGDENFMSYSTERERIPGCKIEISLGFQAGVNAKILTEYASWICKAIYSIISAGIDPEIAITYKGRRTFHGENRVTSTRIVVKKEREVMDFRSFSPMLSPAQFRAYMFCAMYMHAEHSGTTITSGHGSSQGLGGFEAFNVAWNSDTKHLAFNCDYNAYGGFPQAKMEADLRAALKEMSK